MKLQSITLCDFRAFPGQAEYKFDFDKKNHLLIYGENGSGKSSVFKAIKEFFDTSATAADFYSQKNFFSDHLSGTPLTCGRISLQFKPQNGNSNIAVDWAYQAQGLTDNRPTTDTTYVEVRRRKGMLDYLDLVRINLSESDASNASKRPNLFKLLVEGLLFDFPVTVPGGRQIGLGHYWTEVQTTVHRRRSHRSTNKKDNLDLVTQFNSVVATEINRIQSRANGLLSTYFQHPVAISFTHDPVANYEHLGKMQSRRMNPGRLTFDLAFLGQAFPKYETVLNEAKLSAVALAVYLASLLEGIPKGNGNYPRILVLDDVLIGVDMNNRLPVLEILKTEFAAQGWQLILLTHDKIWYNYAAHAATAMDWECYELYAGFSPDATGQRYEQPFLRSAEEGAADYLQRARTHLTSHDDKAAAMYARAAYELTLKNYCDKKHLAIPFYKEVRKLTSDTFFIAIKHALNTQKSSTNPVPAAAKVLLLDSALVACLDIELHRQQVLNPLTHSSPVSASPSEVALAIQSVDELLQALKGC